VICARRRRSERLQICLERRKRKARVRGAALDLESMVEQGPSRATGATLARPGSQSAKAAGSYFDVVSHARHGRAERPTLTSQQSRPVAQLLFQGSLAHSRVSWTRFAPVNGANSSHFAYGASPYANEEASIIGCSARWPHFVF
jgi:hypothetical protein